MARRKGYGMSDALRLAWDVPQVMALRLAKIGRGGAASHTESRRMVTEKVQAAAEAQILLWQAAVTGKPDKGAAAVTRLYRTRVAANKRRLKKS
jgi:hypothetical protein